MRLPVQALFKCGVLVRSQGNGALFARKRASVLGSFSTLLKEGCGVESSNPLGSNPVG